MPLRTLPPRNLLTNAFWHRILSLWTQSIDLAPANGPVFYHYVIVRDDLPLGPLAAQTTHAAGESAAMAHPPHGTHAIVLACPASDLEAIAMRLACADIAHVVIHEPDAPYLGEATAIGIAPRLRTPALLRIVGRLKLVGV